MAYTQGNYAGGPGYYPRHNPGHDFPNQGLTPAEKQYCDSCHTKRYGESKQPSMTKLFKCNHCQFSSNRKFNLQVHTKRKHSNDMLDIQRGSDVHTQQLPRFYQSNHIERNHPGMVSEQSKPGGGVLQNITQPAKYIPRDVYESQRYGNENIINQQRSEVNPHQPPYSRGDVDRNNQRGGRTIQNDDDVAVEFHDFGSQTVGQMKYRKYT